MVQNNWIFETQSYRAVLEKKLESEGSTRGYRTDLARAAGCQLAYVSHVQTGRAELTPDQAAGLCEFWGLDDLQSEYFMTLVHLARAATPRLKTRLQSRLDEIEKQHQKTQRSRLSHESYDPERVVEYYLDWAVSAVQACLTVPRFESLEQIASHLGLEETRVRQILFLLQDLGFIIRDGSKWKVTTRFFHAADEHKFARLHHRNWRQHICENLNGEMQEKHPFHYTSVHSLSRADFLRIRKLLQEAVAQSREIIGPSSEEMVACMVMDWVEL